ncbi:MAG: hypothetical protein ACLTSX_10415 [Collinsella sp.]
MDDPVDGARRGLYRVPWEVAAALRSEELIREDLETAFSEVSPG